MPRRIDASVSPCRQEVEITDQLRVVAVGSGTGQVDRHLSIQAAQPFDAFGRQGLEAVPVDLVQKVKDPKLVGYETEGPGLEALAAGKLDAFLTAEPVANQAIKDGKPFRLLDETAFYQGSMGELTTPGAIKLRDRFLVVLASYRRR